MWCLQRSSTATLRSVRVAIRAQLPLCSRQLSIHAINWQPTNLTLTLSPPSARNVSPLRHSYPSYCSPLQRLTLPLSARSFASQRNNKQRSASNTSNTAVNTPPERTPSPPSAPYFSPSPSSTSPADRGRLIFATTLTLYARGVPYLFLFLLLPLVSFSIYATYEPSTTASAPPTLHSYLSILPLTALPLSFLLLVAAFTRFNRRLISTIHLLPDRRLALTTVNMLPTTASHTPHFTIRPLDSLIPPHAWTGSHDRTLHRLRFVREGEAGGVDEYWLYAAPSKAGQQGVELLRRIMTDNRLSSRELAM